MKFEALINFDAPGGRCDITPVFKDAAAFDDLVEHFAKALEDRTFDLIAGLDALGFVLATAVARRLGKGLILVRKGGKLPVPVRSVEFTDYSKTQKTLEIASGSVPAGAAVVLVEDWVETGAQAKAAIQLIEAEGGMIAGIVAIKIETSGDELGLNGRFCISLLG